VLIELCTGRDLLVGDPAAVEAEGDPGGQVGLEFAVLGAGAAVLAISGLTQWIPVWICAGVGVHFIPLCRVLGDRSLVILGTLISAVALAALITGLESAVAPGAITGAGAGLCLLISGAFTLIVRRLYTGLPPSPGNR
jgi:hypothetical protein